MTTWLRKFSLTAHLTFSVGWLGAVAAFLALAVIGLTSSEDRIVQSVSVAMEPIAWFVIVPLSFASPLTGIIQAIGTSWGLFRHYWVLIKFLITVPSTIFLLFHMQPIHRLAAAAGHSMPLNPSFHGVQFQLVVDAAAALIVLLVATTLAVYKPRGMTPYGRSRM